MGKSSAASWWTLPARSRRSTTDCFQRITPSKELCRSRDRTKEQPDLEDNDHPGGRGKIIQMLMAVNANLEYDAILKVDLPTLHALVPHTTPQRETTPQLRKKFKRMQLRRKCHRVIIKKLYLP